MAAIASVESNTFPCISGYSISEQIYNGRRTAVYRALQLESQQPVIIKTLQTAHPSFSDLAKFRHQFAITNSLSIASIAKPLSLEALGNSYALVMEDVGGISLQQYTRTHTLSLVEVLGIAIQMADILETIFQHHIIHKDIKPANIIIEPKSKRIQLIDFSIASVLSQKTSQKTQSIQTPNGLEGTLAYLSPEQTGRMNRGIDYRTDFYSLGVTLYELLTGTLPFQATDPMELVHCHIAQMPPSPHEVNPDVPAALSNIVLKLMAKNAEDRYQSVLGLKHDLTQCLHQWKETKTVTNFELGEKDANSHFLIPEKLYGRQAEVKALLDAFDRVSQSTSHSVLESGLQSDSPSSEGAAKASNKLEGSSESTAKEFNKSENSSEEALQEVSVEEQSSQAVLNTIPSTKAGHAEIVLVAGLSGTGKTSIIYEVHKPITRQKGYFIGGKFDQFNRNIPLSAFVQAVENLVSQLLSESDQQLSQWRHQILDALGENSQVLIEVIPALEQIIGPQPSAPELSGNAAQTRFNRLFQKFINVVSTQEHPLVVFLDDLQWTDSASLQLITQLMQNSQHLLLLCAYRNNEVSPAHPFMLTVEALRAEDVRISTITLSSLSLTQVNQLVADTLHCQLERSQPLGDLIFRKTKGNPFFTTQFLKALYEENGIHFNTAQGEWDWHLDQVTEMSLSEDIVAFMTKQLQQLPSATQDILKLAACIGSQFDLETLSTVSKQSMTLCSAALWPALQAGILLTDSNVYEVNLEIDLETKLETNPEASIEEKTDIEDIETTENITYRFLHDRVIQAAYSSIPEEQKQATHYSIGKLLLKNLSSETQEERIFELTNQLNRGIELITEQVERDELAQLNLIACRKARASIAYQAGQTYTQVGIQLLGRQAWQRQYDTVLAFHNLATELAWLCNDADQMEKSFLTVITQSRSPFDQIAVYRIKTRSKTAQNKPAEALEVGLAILSRLGMSFPQAPTPQDVQEAMLSVNKLIGDRTIRSLAELPVVNDQEQIATIDMLMDVSPAAYLTGSPLYPLLIAVAVKRSIQYGNTARSAHVYASYGLITCNLAKAIDMGVAYGKLAQQLIASFNIPIAKPDTLVVTGMFLTHRSHHIKDSLSVLQEAYSAAIEVGNLEATGYAAAVVCSNAYWCAQPLIDLTQEISTYAEELDKLKLLATANWCRIYQQTILNLSTLETKEPHLLSGKLFTEAELLRQLQAGQDLVALYFFYLNKLVLSYIFGEIECAQTQTAEVRQYMGILPGVVEEAAFYFYSSLTAIATLPSRLDSLSETTSLTENKTEHPTAEHEREVFAQITENQTRLREDWANYAPMNHQHKVDLIEAEKCRVLGQKMQAIEQYDQAIAAARSNGYIQEAALANELAAKFYLDWGKEKVAAGYLQEAYYDYARWGANAKVAQLEATYPQLLSAIIETRMLGQMKPNDPLLTANTTFSTGSLSSLRGTHTTQNIWLDLPAVMKAAQAISQEIGLTSLLAKLMKIVLANAGAQTGHFIGYQDNRWVVMAKAEQIQTETQSSTLDIELDSYCELSHSVVYSVARTKESAVFENLSGASQFAGDLYINTRQPLSVLCLPVHRQGQLVGILYLENNLTTGVFTRDRIEILQLLTAQAAISLENARLYQQTQTYSQTLEIEVANQTQALNQKAEDLETALQDLKKTQAHLVHTAKMSSLGQTVAGVAHEINNPVNFIKGNIKHTKRAFKDLTGLLELYQEKYPQPDIEIEALQEEIDLDFLVDDVINGLDSMAVGSDRISQIVLSLRNFSRLDESGIKAGDLHAGLESTLLLINNQLQQHQLKSRVKIVKSYGDLPPVICDHSQLNQVFLNILNNAVDAIQSQLQSAQDKTKTAEIQIYTDTIESNQVEIIIANTGEPIDPTIQEKIFDPFFTTKAIGQGSGLGLFVCYSVIEQHQGNIIARSQTGGKTEFVITLPVRTSGKNT